MSEDKKMTLGGMAEGILQFVGIRRLRSQKAKAQAEEAGSSSDPLQDDVKE